MLEAVVLFVDNDPDFLKIRSEFLEQEDYKVIPAGNPAEAKRKLETKRIDLAILDIRLMDDDDEKDESGLILAKQWTNSVPIIILTGFPTVDYVREMFRPQTEGISTAVEFLYKEEGPEAMIRAVENAFTQHVRFNRKMDINWINHENLSFQSFVDSIDPGIDSSLMTDRAGELEVLFRKLFFDASGITMGPLQWQRLERICTTVSVQSSDGISKRRKVVFGLRSSVSQETPIPKKIVSDKTFFAETIHYFAVSYASSAKADPNNG